MAWTNPRDWTDEELIDETIMNAHVRDNLKYLKSISTDNTVSYEGESVYHEGNAVTV